MRPLWIPDSLPSARLRQNSFLCPGRARDLHSKPMKGTAVRSLTLAQDKANMAWLAQSEKNRGRKCDDCGHDSQRYGARGANRQRGRAKSCLRWNAIPRLLPNDLDGNGRNQCAVKPNFLPTCFPAPPSPVRPRCGQWKLLKRWETPLRAAFTRVRWGFISPNGQAQFNVAIRTVLVDKAAGRATYGVGSGIVWGLHCSG